MRRISWQRLLAGSFGLDVLALGLATTGRFGLGLGLLLHGIAVAGFLIALKASPGGGTRLRERSALGLAVGVLILQPVVGFLLALVLFGPKLRHRLPTPGDAQRYVLGNPLTRIQEPAGDFEPVAPVVTRLREAPSGILSGTIGWLRETGRFSGVTLLRRLQQEGDSRTQLLAGAALSTIQEAGARRLSDSQRRVLVSPGNRAAKLARAAVLRESAETGLGTPDENRTCLEEASRLLADVWKRHPDDPGALLGWCRCQFALQDAGGELEEAARRLRSARGLEEAARLYHCRYLARQGSWRALAQASAEDSGKGVPDRCRNFWGNGSRPMEESP